MPPSEPMPFANAVAVPAQRFVPKSIAAVAEMIGPQKINAYLMSLMEK
jgi:hypothetical protein